MTLLTLENNLKTMAKGLRLDLVGKNLISENEELTRILKKSSEVADSSIAFKTILNTNELKSSAIITSEFFNKDSNEPTTPSFQNFDNPELGFNKSKSTLERNTEPYSTLKYSRSFQNLTGFDR